MTLINMLSSSSERNPSAPAIVMGDLKLSYSDWFHQIKIIAGAINGLGLEPGDHLLTILSNRSLLIFLTTVRLKIIGKNFVTPNSVAF